MAKKKKWYVVWKGRIPGIYETWEQASEQVHGYGGAQYQSFPSRKQAEQAYQNGYQVARKAPKLAKQARQELLNEAGPIWESVAVDAACSGNPGMLEYRGVWTVTGESLFHQGPFAQGTNNIGEFLALVHALAYLKEEGLNIPIYSDSKIAIGWLKRKKCNTQLEANEQNARLFELIEETETWLQETSYDNKILKWDTIQWGENPADFGRK